MEKHYRKWPLVWQLWIIGTTLLSPSLCAGSQVCPIGLLIPVWVMINEIAFSIIYATTSVIHDKAKENTIKDPKRNKRLAKIYSGLVMGLIILIGAGFTYMEYETHYGYGEIELATFILVICPLATLSLALILGGLAYGHFCKKYLNQ